MVLELIQPLTERSVRSLSRSKELPAREADNLAAICEPRVTKCVILVVS
jgi:hypothetical protein